MREVASLAILVIIAATCVPAVRADDNNAGVYVIGALHLLHEEETHFDYPRLREVIVSLDPAVMALEVRPEELSERKDTPGRPEYPAVLWGLLDQQRYEAVAMELGGEAYTQFAGPAQRLFKAFERDRVCGARTPSL